MDPLISLLQSRVEKQAFQAGISRAIKDYKIYVDIIKWWLQSRVEKQAFQVESVSLISPNEISLDNIYGGGFVWYANQLPRISLSCNPA